MGNPNIEFMDLSSSGGDISKASRSRVVDPEVLGMVPLTIVLPLVNYIEIMIVLILEGVIMMLMINLGALKVMMS